MVNWIHFPKNKPLDKVSAQIVKAFEAVDATIDSYTHQLKSDEVLTAVRPGLEALGFDVEKSKKSDDLVAVPVLYGVNGKIEKAFEADGYLSTAGYVIEVEAGRAVVNYQFLKDFLLYILDIIQIVKKIKVEESVHPPQKHIYLKVVIYCH